MGEVRTESLLEQIARALERLAKANEEQVKLSAEHQAAALTTHKAQQTRIAALQEAELQDLVQAEKNRQAQLDGIERSNDLTEKLLRVAVEALEIQKQKLGGK